MSRIFRVLSLIAIVQVAASEEDCIPLETKELRAYYGWPILLECNEVAEYYGLDGDDYQCNITGTDTNERFYSVDFDYYSSNELPSYEIENVTANLTSEIRITIQATSGEDCCYQTLNLRKEILPTTTCAKFHESHDSSPREAALYQVLSCVLPYSSDEPKLDDIQDYPVTWYYNCGSNLPDGVQVGESDKKLVILSFDPLKHIGSYACSIEYNGETRYITEYNLCDKPKRPKADISVFCKTDQIRYNVGDTATIECGVNVGSSELDPKFFTMNFYPLLENGKKNVARDNVSCLSELERERSSDQQPYPIFPPKSLDERVNCSFKQIGKFEEVCMSQIPTPEEWEREKNKTLQVLHMTYTMKNIQKDDFGSYQAFVRYNTNANNATDVVTISKDRCEKQRAALIGGALAGTAIVLIIIGVLLYYFHLHLRVLWRRSLCAPYDTDTLEYGAYFTYSWSNNEVDEATANKKYGDLIFGMRDFVQELGFDIYDPAEKPAQYQWDIKNIQEVQHKCDRVIIILTGQFLEQPTAEQELYENFLDKTYILVRTPDFESAFKGLTPDRKNGLKAHFQRNLTIKWSGEGGALSKKFQMELELAMPKKGKDLVDDTSSFTLESRI